MSDIATRMPRFGIALVRALDQHELTVANVSHRVKLDKDKIHDFIHSRRLPSGGELTQLASLMPELSSSLVRNALLQEKATFKENPLSAPLTHKLQIVPPLTTAADESPEPEPRIQPVVAQDAPPVASQPAPVATPPAPVEAVPEVKPMPPEAPKPPVKTAPKESFPKALIRAREDAHLSRKELAELLGVQSSTVFEWERGIWNPIQMHYDALLELLPILKTALKPSSRDMHKPGGNGPHTVQPVAEKESPMPASPVAQPAPTQPMSAPTQPSLPQMMIRWSRLVQQDLYTKTDVKELLSLAVSLGMTREDIVQSFPDNV